MDRFFCEVYVKGHYIDYVVLFGDTSVTWGDVFPEEDQEESAAASSEEGEESKKEDDDEEERVEL
jgi:hypothetical protein